MDTQNNNKMWMWVGVVVAILLVIVLYTLYKSSGSTPEYTGNIPQTHETTPAPIPQTVVMKHQYVSGTHTYAGSINLPTPCTQFTVTAVTDPANTSHTTLAFTTSEGTTAGQVCAQVITSRPFKVSFQGPKTAVVDATLDGTHLILNVFEVPAGVNLDTYNITIKG